ncbi:hypothetical protein C1E23_17285 [Pseudoalteromonas phenolica]|uniref:Fibronectin type-III domain-containing protein n=1 Tax=Pseudoalteromonas phenolica TaxID=161398 RepID=A0A4Q7IJN7_9GAMM|nr:hypothetical protein C1E23_17285 [Pseudoalteromonas phenolica]
MLPSFAFANLFGQLCFEEQSSFSISNRASTQSPSTSLPSFMALPGDCFGCSDSGDVKKPTHLQLSKSGTNLTLMWEDGGQGACQSTASTGLLEPYKPSVSYTIQQNVNGVWKSQTYQSTRRAFSVHGVLGNTYKFRVKACDSQLNKCSSYSESSNVITLPKSINPPNKPVLAPSVTTYQHYAYVNISKVLGASYYNIEQIDTYTGDKVYKRTNATSDIYVSTIANRRYEYRYAACNNDAGCSAYSPKFSARYEIKPFTPNYLKITYEKQLITLSWKHVYFNSSFFPEGLIYKVTLRKMHSTSTRYFETDSNNLSFTTDEPGHYYFQVESCDKVNSMSCSGFDGVSELFEVYKIPSTPNIHNVFHSTQNHQIYVVTHHKEKEAQKYELKQFLNTQYLATKEIDNLVPPANSKIYLEEFFNIEYNRYYSFYVRACNETGCSGWGSKLNYLTILEPKKAENLNLQIQGLSLIASWQDAPIDPQDFPEGVNYEVEALKGGLLFNTVSTDDNIASISLDGEGEYTFKVRTCDKSNTVNCSQWANLGYQVKYVKPLEVSNLNLQAQGTAINATWSHAPIDPADFQLAFITNLNY